MWYLMNSNLLTLLATEAKYAFWLGPVGPTDKENQVKMYKKYCFRYITFLKW
jgi:hypothetical protein